MTNRHARSNIPRLAVLLLVATFVRGSIAVAGADSPNGGTLFLKHCASCHGKDGKARTPAARKLGVKDLTVSKTTRAEIERQIRMGRNDEKGTQRMPPFAGKLKDDEITALADRVTALRPSK